MKTRTHAARGGFTLVELMVVMAISAMMLLAGMNWIPKHVANFWLTKGAASVHAQLIESRAAALAGYRGKPERVVGFRMLPDPFWPLVRLSDGTIDRTAPIGYARTVPLTEAAPHRAGLASVHPDGYPDGFAPAYGRLVLEESPVDADGHRCEPTTWFWLIRLGDVVTVHGRDYTVCGPTLVPPGPDNPDGFVNWGWPGATTSPLDRGAGPMEWLYLCNRADDDGDGSIDEGWNGLDDDLDGFADEADEWEAERWLNLPVAGLTAAPYSIRRRPIAADARSGGDVANDKLVPSPVVVDGRRSILPVNPITGSVDIAFDEHGGCSTPSFYGKPATLPMGVNKLCFWVVARADVLAEPDPDRDAKVVTLDLRSGVVATADGDPMDVAGTLARLEAGR